jgi:hypothetical protein
MPSLSPPSTPARSRRAVARPHPAAATEEEEGIEKWPPGHPLTPSLTARPRLPPITEQHAAPPSCHAPTPQRARAPAKPLFDRWHGHGPEQARRVGPQLQRARLRPAARHRPVTSLPRPARVLRRRAALLRRPATVSESVPVPT